jgi:flagellar basal body P-ring formation protein FlgA
MKKYKTAGFLIILLWASLNLTSPAWSQSAISLAHPRPGQVLGSEEMAGLLSGHIQKMAQDASRRVEIRDFRSHEKITLPSGNLSYQIFLSDQAVRGGNLSGAFILYADRQEVQKIRFNARAEIYTDVVMAKNYLKRNQEITASDVRLANKNIALLPPDVVTDLREVLGKRTTLAINPQEVLRVSMMEIPPLVQKGERVIILFENPQFRITALGEAREGGRKGDRVKLVNLSSRKEVYGRVLNANTVQVDF